MTDNLTIHLASRFGAYLSSRHNGALLRREILEVLDSTGGECHIDFADVWSVSDSFADELLAVLIVQKGEDWFKQHIKALNLSDDVRLSVLESIDRRLSGVV